MPIFRINGQMHYFAHVPKCGGNSVTRYLEERFGPIDLHQDPHNKVPVEWHWSKISMAHVPVVTLQAMFPEDWIVSSFAVVRHPMRRLVSAFFFARHTEKRLPPSVGISEWFLDTAARLEKNPFLEGGHLIPQTAMVPKGAQVFRLEDGLDQIVPHLDSLAGNQDGPRSIAVRNKGRWRDKDTEPELSPEAFSVAMQLYADDFARFGYAVPEDAAAISRLADLPPAAARAIAQQAEPRTKMKRLLRYIERRIEKG